MDEGDWIALVAVVVSVTAASISIWQAWIARRSADAAKEQARYAREQAEAATQANELTRQQMDREEVRIQQAAAEAESAALREAEKVKLEFAGSGGSVVVSITNNGMVSITEVELLRVWALQEGPWAAWSVNRNMPGGPLTQTRRSILHPYEEMKVATWLLDRDGQHVGQLPEAVEALVRFRDQDGQWWEVTAGDEPPARVSPPTA
ncbi:hypothetical protein [Streptomyces lateritius]|uniref:hypothetical protein n=1 Tax=Streptomyces lateritius TaxID=67313 RepID=UPI00167A359D|nr:hypothetical protein [Streptomyces lateritius]GGU10882.1 hypothetical protein GCM10010272_64850 [Streptomyces lateritius]